MRPKLNSFYQLTSYTWAFVFFSLLGAGIVALASTLTIAGDPTVPHSSNFYHVTFTRFEPLALYTAAAFFAGLGWLLFRDRTARPAPAFLSYKNLPLWIALGVLLCAGVGRFAIYQNFDLCIDECLNDFEVQILNHHHILAIVPVEWRNYADAMRLPYVQYNAVRGSWTSGFLPGFACLDYLLSSANLSWAIGPLLGAASILLLAGVARRIFPETPALAANVAVLLLAFSPQFMAMDMTKFAWPAHLCGTLLWLWLLTHPNRYLFLLTPLVGALLIGVHQPHVHPLIAAPFVLRLLCQGRWKSFLWFTFWYLLGAWCWYQVFGLLRPTVFTTGADVANMTSPTSITSVIAVVSAIYTIFHSVTLFAWATPVLFLFVILFLKSWKQQPVMIRDAACAIGLTFGFYFFFPHVQGHGWGYRYLHSAYGLLALVATAGALNLFREGFGGQAAKALLASVVFSLLIQFPYRAYEMRTMVRPLALTWDYMSHLPSDFVIIKTSTFWYSWDLVRNDPWLQRKPIFFNEQFLTEEERASLYRKGSVIEVGADEVRPFGVIISDPAKKVPYR